MTQWTRQPVDVDGNQVMTFSAGDGPRTLLMAHGGPGCPSRYLRDSHHALVERGLRLVTWDQLGCGESDRPTNPHLWNLERFVTEMETVRSAFDLETVDILGQSWGGVLGLEYVLRHPDRVNSFIAADAAFDLPRMQAGFDRAKAALGAETVTMMARHEAEGTTDHPEYQAAVTMLMYRHVCRLHPWPESLTWCMANLGEDVFTTMFGPYFFQCTGTLRNWDRMDDLPEIRTRVLLVHGEHDYIVPELAAMARDRIPDAELAFFPGCSHMPFFEAPQRYIDTVADFLSLGRHR
jgi:proline iminopeptidase